jgi:hypothetical protein
MQATVIIENDFHLARPSSNDPKIAFVKDSPRTVEMAKVEPLSAIGVKLCDPDRVEILPGPIACKAHPAIDGRLAQMRATTPVIMGTLAPDGSHLTARQEQSCQHHDQSHQKPRFDPPFSHLSPPEKGPV